MTTPKLREWYADELFKTVLSEPAPFYEAFDGGETGMNDFLTSQWERVCQKAAVSLADYPFFPEIAFWLLDETEEQFACLMVAALPPLAGEPEDALLTSVVFGATMDPRCFSGVSDGGTVTVTEYTAVGGEINRQAVGSFPDTRERQQAMAETVYAVCDRYEDNS